MAIGACATTLAHAETSYTLPLQGYFRPGKTMPVEIVSGATPRELRLPNAVPVSIDFPGSKVIPVLMLHSEHASSDTPGLMSLGERDRLVLSTVDGEEAAVALFPDQHVIVIHRAAPSGLFEAWETLDGLVTDEPLMPGEARQLLGNGTSIVSLVEPRADDRLPWKREGNRWTIRSITPDLSAAATIAYDTMAAWNPGLRRDERLQLIAIACLCGLLCLASLLYQRRGRTAVRAATVVLCLVAMLKWRDASEPIRSVEGTISLDKEDLEQADDWIFARARRDTDRSRYSPPLLRDREHARAIGLMEHIRSSGGVEWCYRQRRGELSVEVGRRCPTPPFGAGGAQAIASPLIDIARAVYAEPGMSVTTSGTSSFSAEYGVPSVRVAPR